MFIIIGSEHHGLAKSLRSPLQPFLNFYSKHCIKNSFTLVETDQQCNLDSVAIFFCFFDISSVFTNVSLTKTIHICSNTLYTSKLVPPTISKILFTELLPASTTLIDFSCNNTMYERIDGGAMGSPLGPAFANIFV